MSSADPEAARPRSSLLVLSGSLSPEGRTDRVLGWAADAFEAAWEPAGLAVDRVRACELELADGRTSDEYGSVTREAISSASRSVAMLVGSPMYRGAITGGVKNYFDLVDAAHLRGVPAAIVTTAGSAQHWLGVDLSLYPVLRALQMFVVPSSLYVERRDDDDAVRASAQHLGAALARLADLCSDGRLDPGPG